MDDVVLGHIADAGIGVEPGTANDAVVPNLPGGRRLQSGEDLQQCGLTCATATRNGDQLARFDRQRQVLKDLPRANIPAHVDRIDPPAGRRCRRVI